MLKQSYRIFHFNYNNNQKVLIELFEKKIIEILIKRVINFINNKCYFYSINKNKNNNKIKNFNIYKNFFNFKINTKIKKIYLPLKINKFSILKSSFVHKKAQKSYNYIIYKQLNIFILNQKKS
jgi:ribosomal protein S10